MIEKIQCENCGGTDMVQVGRGLFRCQHCGVVYRGDSLRFPFPAVTLSSCA